MAGLVLILIAVALAAVTLPLWLGRQRGWVATRYVLRGWLPLALLLGNGALAALGLGLILIEADAPRPIITALLVLVPAAVVAGIVTLLVGAPRVALPRWIAARRAAGDLVRIPDLPPALWGRGLDRDGSGQRLPPTGHRSEEVSGWEAELRRTGWIEFGFDQRVHRRGTLLLAVVVAAFAAAGFGALFGTDQTGAGVALLVLAGVLALVFAMSRRMTAQAATPVRVSRDGIALLGELLTWPEVGAVGVQAGQPFSQVVLTVTPDAHRRVAPALGRVGALRGDHGPVPELRLPMATVANPWLLGLFLARVHRRVAGDPEAFAMPGVARRTWIRPD